MVDVIEQSNEGRGEEVIGNSSTMEGRGHSGEEAPVEYDEEEEWRRERTRERGEFG